ncbi:MAG: hypothetical protein ABR866_10945 [Candidatus Korobacteraceae bacterium]
MTSTPAKGQATDAQPRKSDAFSRCRDKWLEGTIRPWTRDAMKRHLEVAFNSGAGAPQAWPWAQHRVATIMLDALAPHQLSYRSDGSPEEADFASSSDAEANNQWYRELVRRWLHPMGITKAAGDECPGKRPGEGTREYAARTRQFWREKRELDNKAEQIASTTPQQAHVPNPEWLSEDEALQIWTVLARRFAQAVEDGIGDAKGRLSELSRGRNKRHIVSLDTCGRDLHHPLLTDLRTSTDLSSAECYREIQQEAQPSAPAKPKKAEKPPRSEFDERRDAIIFTAIKSGLKGRDYCRFLDSHHCAPCPGWERKYGWPETYLSAYASSKWTRRITLEKNRAKRRMDKLSPGELKRILGHLPQKSL